MAADPRLVAYINEQVSAGYRKEQIYQVLIDAGWKSEQINQAIYEIMGKSPTVQPSAPSPQAQPAQNVAPQTPQTPGIFWKLKSALFHPGRFFEKVKSEKSFTKPLAFYGIITAVNSLASFLIISLFTANLPPEVLKNSLLIYIPVSSLLDNVSGIGAVINYLIVLTETFIGAGILHLFIRLFGQNKGFYQTYKALMYSYAPMLLAWPIIPIVLFGISSVSLSVMPLVLGATGYVLFLAFWQLYLLIKGLSEFHEISAGRALMVIIAMVITVLILVFLVVGLFAAIFFMGAFNPSTYTVRSAIGFGELGEPADWQYSGTTLSVVLRNQAGQNIVVTSVSSPSCTSDTAEKTISSGGTTTFTLTACPSKSVGSSFSQQVTVSYSVAGGLPRTATGTVTGTAV